MVEACLLLGALPALLSVGCFFGLQGKPPAKSGRFTMRCGRGWGRGRDRDIRSIVGPLIGNS